MVGDVPGMDIKQKRFCGDAGNGNGWFLSALTSSILSPVFIYSNNFMKKIIPIIFALSLTISSLLFSQESYHLIWSDEFDYSGSPASACWSFDLGDHGWGNNELQNYTDSRENSVVQDGKLIIKAIKKDNIWTSARLVTKNKVDFLYGRIEARAKLPAGKGTWPAIWILSTDREYGGWPESGEIDIMEHVGYDPGNVHATVHTRTYNGSLGTQLGNSIMVPDYSTAFHTYTMEWNSEKVDFYLDDEKYFTFNNDKTGNTGTWPFDKRFHLILNIAIGGNWGGIMGIDPDLTEATMEIDYVRLYSLNAGK